jgi:hypothetical protein
MNAKGYDLIGDIHGHADELKALLETMDYQNIDGCYRHASRQVIFLGDFIDRGPEQMGVLNIVMPMVEQGAALAVMGNHEFNALAFHTPHPDQTGVWLRPRTNKNMQQHFRFLDEYLNADDKRELDRVLNFFWSLPLWLDLDWVRVVHACWEQRHVDALGNDNRLTMKRLVEASTRGTTEYNAIEALLKGVEYELPEGKFFHDKDSHRRTAVRTQWWHNADATIGDIAFPKGEFDGDALADEVISANDLVGYPADGKPVFIGHYWMQGTPELMADNVACLDYSVAKDGKLVAYRWDGEQTLSSENFIHVQ